MCSRAGSRRVDAFSWSPNGSGEQGRALYSFFHRVKVLQKSKYTIWITQIFNPQKLWISLRANRLQNPLEPMVSGLELNWRFFRQRKISLFFN